MSGLQSKTHTRFALHDRKIVKILPEGTEDSATGISGCLGRNAQDMEPLHELYVFLTIRQPTRTPLLRLSVIA